MIIKSEKQFKAKFPKLYALLEETAVEDCVDLVAPESPSGYKFRQLTLFDEEYAEILYVAGRGKNYVLEFQGSEDGSFGEWKLESSVKEFV